MRFRVFSLWLIFFILTGCTSQRIIFNQAIPEVLDLQLVRAPAVSEINFDDIRIATNEFVQEFNQQEHPFKLVLADSDTAAITLEIVKNSYVSSSQQALGVFVTVAGIITPILMIYAGAPVYVTFWYIPRNLTNLMISYSPVLVPGGVRLYHSIQTRHKFQDLEQQKTRQKDAYTQFLRELLTELEINSKKQSK